MAIAFSSPSEAQPPQPASGARGAAGVIVQYEEAPGSNVIYMEEGGGMVSATAAPVPVKRKPLAAPAAKTEPPAPKPSGSATRLAKRRVAPAEGAGGKP